MAHLAQFSALAALYGHVGAGPIAIRTLMLTYLLVGGWLVRRLGLDGRGRSIAGVVLLVLSLVPMPPTVRDGWPVVRTLLNAVASGPALVWGLVHGGRPARDGGLVMVTGMRSGTGPRSEVMVGSVLLTRHPRQKIGAPLVQHELRHADQWAVIGPLLMPPAYWLAEGAGDVLSDCGHGGNIFEIGAGLRAGGYDSRTEIRCAGLLSSPGRQGGVRPPRWALDWALPPALPVSRHSAGTPPRPRRRYRGQGPRPNVMALRRLDHRSCGASATLRTRRWDHPGAVGVSTCPTGGSNGTLRSVAWKSSVSSSPASSSGCSASSSLPAIGTTSPSG